MPVSRVKGKGETGEDPWRKAWEKAGEGAVAVVDCREEIPCDPCEQACHKGAIVVGEDIFAPPRYDPELCDGCGRCVTLCPGMAIFMLDRSGGGGKARVTVPYEMRGGLRRGGTAWAVDAEGKALGEGKIIRAVDVGRQGRTGLVTLEVPEEWALKVRGVKDRVITLEEPQEASACGGGGDFHLCRCEEIPASRVKELAHTGFLALGAIRRYSRAGLGYCQGRFCQSLLAGELACATGKEVGGLGISRVRPPVRPVRLGRLGGGDG